MQGNWHSAGPSVENLHDMFARGSHSTRSPPASVILKDQAAAQRSLQDEQCFNDQSVCFGDVIGMVASNRITLTRCCCHGSASKKQCGNQGRDAMCANS